MFVIIWKNGSQVRYFPTHEEVEAFLACSCIDDAAIYQVDVDPIMGEEGSTEAKHMRRLMYLSKATDPSDITPEHLADIARVATLRNVEIGVSGFLIYSEPFFFQVIEGKEEDLDFLFNKISQDDRHERCIVLSNTDVKGRLYGDWHMKDSHIDNITSHPAIKTILFQIAKSFSSMWSYLPKTTATALLNNKDPAAQPPEPMSAVVMFISLSGFDAFMSNPVLREQLSDLLSAFVDACVVAIEGHGGTVAKFFTGMCLAYFSTSRAEEALQAVQELQQSLADLRAQQPRGSILSMLYCRAGIHYGRALLCNAGIRKSDFTLLGDCINTASRTHSLAKKQSKAFLLTFEVRCLLGPEMREELESAGTHQVKGRDKPVVVYTLSSPPVDEEKIIEQVSRFSPGSYRSADPVLRYEDCPKERKPPLFNTDSVNSKAHGGWSSARGGARDDILNTLMHIAKMAEAPVVGGDRNQLTTLTYISHATKQMSRMDLSNIQRVAVRRNAQRNITGCLLYVNGLFVQTLEGQRKEVITLYDKIRKDRRHTDVVTVHLAPLHDRVYATMSMGSNTEDMLNSFPPLKDVLGQLARSFISLETYVPSVVVRFLTAGSNPRALAPISTDVVMFSTDIVSFTPLSERASMQEVWMICNTFIDGCTKAVINEGGEVMKLIGDCVTAYFDPSKADGAVAASCELVIFTAQLREAFSDVMDIRQIVHCGVGLDAGNVIMAQCGTQGLSEFVVAGEVSARVMDVEAATREAGYKICMTEPVADLLSSRLKQNLVPVPETVGGANLYGYDGEDFLLDTPYCKTKIREFHEKRAAIAAAEAEGRELKTEPQRQQPPSAPVSAPPPAPLPTRAPAPVHTPAHTPAHTSQDEGLAAETYVEACEMMDVKPNTILVQRLQRAESTQSVDCSNLVQDRQSLAAVLGALGMLTEVNEVKLASCNLDDDTVEDVVDACSQLSNLQKLDVSGNRNVKSATSLKRLLQACHRLRDITVTGCGISATDARKLQVCVDANRMGRK